MTYIKWKDEVESYLGSVPEAEKQKIFSYFSEMYADKRDAGKSEAQIIEEFGAPYDVAKRILADCRESAPQQPDNDGARASSASGGNNYNYNYYNYNYGGAPQAQTGTPPAPEKAQAAPRKQNGEPDRNPEDARKKKGAGHTVLCVFLVTVYIFLAVALIGSAIAAIIEGFASIGGSIGALVASSSSAGATVAGVGYGLIECGVGFILLAPFSVLCKFVWGKIRKFMKGE